MLATTLMEKETLSREQVMNMLFNVKSQKKARNNRMEPEEKERKGTGTTVKLKNSKSPVKERVSRLSVKKE